MDKQQIIDYIMHTPSNTNPAMLRQFLDEYSGGSEENWSTLFEDEVTTEEQDGISGGIISQSNGLNVNTIKVTFNNIEYECNKIEMNSAVYYGGVNTSTFLADFSEYPFALMSFPNGGIAIYTEVPGTYSIKIEVPQESGGSGDWSTAEVTFLNKSTTAYYYVKIASVTDSYIESIEHQIPYGIETRLADRVNPGTKTITIPLYKNGYILDANSLSNTNASFSPQITGDITFNNDEFTITGNGTITLYGKTTQ